MSEQANSSSNPKDPLLKVGSQSERELFERLTRTCDGFASDQVLNASLNLAINALRQTYASRAAVDQVSTELFGKAKQLLLDHYDSVTGKRKSIFPFTQHVHAAYHDARKQR